MKVKELLAFISEEELAFLVAETKVDFQVKKLDGVVMFQLILFSLLETPLGTVFHRAANKRFGL